MKDTSDSGFVEYEEVLVTFNPGDRAILKSILEAEGIDYFLQGEHATTYAFQAIPVGLMVRKDQADTVRELLKDFEIKPIFANLIEPEDKPDQQ